MKKRTVSFIIQGCLAIDLVLLLVIVVLGSPVAVVTSVIIFLALLLAYALYLNLPVSPL